MSRPSQYVAMTKDERNAADGCFSTACYIVPVQLVKFKRISSRHPAAAGRFSCFVMTFPKIYSADRAQGGFLATTQPLDLRGTAGALRILSCQTPLHSPPSKALEAACPVHDTHATGVVTQATPEYCCGVKNPPAIVLPFSILSLHCGHAVCWFSMP